MPMRFEERAHRVHEKAGGQSPVPRSAAVLRARHMFQHGQGVARELTSDVVTLETNLWTGIAWGGETRERREGTRWQDVRGEGNAK